MSWSEIFGEGEFSFAFARQAVDLVTAGTSWVWCDTDMPQITPEAAQTDTMRSKSQRGSTTPVLAGREWYRISVKFPEQGQLAPYDPTSDTPALVGAMGLLDWWGGSAALTYQAAGVDPVDGKTVTLTTSTGKLGCLVAALESDGTVDAMGFVKSQTGAGPWTATLFEDMKAQPGAGTARLPTLTLFPGTGAVVPYTLRVVGEDAFQDYRYVGCVPVAATRTYEEDRPMWEVQFVCYAGEVRGTDGGLQDHAAVLMNDNILGNGRHVVASNVFSALNDGTVDSGTCNVRNLSLSVELPHRISYCPTAPQGVNAVKIGSPIFGASFAVPEISDFEDVADEQFAVSAWRAGTRVSLSCYEGDRPGVIHAWAMRSATVRSLPTMTFIDGVLHRQVEVQAGSYIGDGAGTDAGNKPMIMAVG